MAQQVYDPIDYGFQFTADWYTFNRAEASKLALKARNEAAKKYAELGYEVRKFILSNQLRTMGGIGSNHPEISVIVSVYGLNIKRPAGTFERYY
jgi:hypothetical protein